MTCTIEIGYCIRELHLNKTVYLKKKEDRKHTLGDMKQLFGRVRCRRNS